jgi:hypothetical protein
VAQPRPRPRAHVQIGAAGGYLHTLGRSFGGGVVDVRIGGSNRVLTLAFRANALVGRSEGGLTFQRPLGGFQLQLHVHDRVRVGFSVLNGVFVYQRALATDDRNVYGLAFGMLGDLDVELVRGRDANALVLSATLGYERVDSGQTSDGHTISAQLGLAWRRY